jgi:hypothetical protein
MLKKRGLLRNSEEEDPMAGMANLFDLGMVLAVALMVALVTRFDMPEMLSEEDYTIVKNPGKADMEIIIKKDNEIIKYKSGQGTGKGGGKKVGAAYQLENGEIIYVPED